MVESLKTCARLLGGGGGGGGGGVGVRSGLVVTMPGSQTWVGRFDSPLDPHKRVGLVAM